MFLSPYFEVYKANDSHIITPVLDKKGNPSSYLFVEKLGVSGVLPLVLRNKIERERMFLCSTDGVKSMWLYPNGEIKTEI